MGLTGRPTMARTHPYATGRRGEAGFTLTELLVVLAVVALIAAAAPVLVQSALPGARALSAARTLANDLRATRGRAIASGTPAVMQFDAALRTYQAEPSGAARELPTGIGFSTPLKLRRVTFYPDGSSSGGTVILTDGTNVHRLAVDRFTGRVAVDE